MTKKFEVEVIKHIGELWIVEAENKEEAKRLFDEGELVNVSMIEYEANMVKEIEKCNQCNKIVEDFETTEDQQVFCIDCMEPAND